MKIQYCSDLHLEFDDNLNFINENAFTKVGDILVIAGDLLPMKLMQNPMYQSELLYLCKDFEKVFWLMGNHEYYRSVHFGHQHLYSNPIKIIPNLFLVDNHTEIIGKTKLIFSTMWTKISPEMAQIIAQGMNDFYQIMVEFPQTETRKLMEVSDFNHFHSQSIQFIKSEVEKAKNEKLKSEIQSLIVVTHHVPTMKNYPDIFIDSKINQAFAVDLSEFIEQSVVDYWIHGHHHFNHGNFQIGNTKILTNQLGYVKFGENKDFRWESIISV